MEEGKVKSGKGKYIAIIIILCLLVCGLGGFIVYDKFLSPSSKTKDTEETVKKDDTEKVEETEKEEVVDLSQIPSVDSSCTFEFKMSDYNAFTNKYRYGLSCYGEYKYIITDAIVDGKKIDVQVVDGTVDVVTPEASGAYINGKKIASLYDEFMLDLKEVSVHDNMLFAHIDGGSYILGTTEIIAYDKNGKEVYKLSDHTSSLNGGINRSTVKINDNSITFSTVASDGFSKGNSYVINFSNGVFSQPTITG